MEIKVNTPAGIPAVHENTARAKSAEPQPAAAVRTDTVTISGEGKKTSEKLKQFWSEHDRLYAQQTAQAMECVTEGMQMALEIYKRIASGAKVSPEDEQHLMLYSKPMYMAAKNAQAMKEKQKDMSHDSLIKDFEERHADDRKDWTSELDAKIDQLNQSDTAESPTEYDAPAE